MRGRVGAPDRGQGGIALWETVLALALAGTAILSIAYGLLVSTRTDNDINTQQRLNLALTTFLDNLPYLGPGGSGCTPQAHAATLLQRTLNIPNPGGGPPPLVPNPEVQRWRDRGVVFQVTDVEYARWQVTGTAGEDFTAPCNAPGPSNPSDPYYPTIRVSVEACWGGAPNASTCPAEAVRVSGQAIRRGGRSGGSG